MKKEIIIKRVYYTENVIDYVFVPIRIPTWLLDNWFTEQSNWYYYLSPMTDKDKDIVLKRLDSNSNSSSKRLYLIKAVKTFSNKTITPNTSRSLIERSVPCTSKYAPVLTKNIGYIIGGNYTFRLKLETYPVINEIHPSLDDIFTKIIQDEGKL